MKQAKPVRCYVFLLVATLVCLAATLCGAAYFNDIADRSVGIKLNTTTDSAATLVPKTDGDYFFVQRRNQQTQVSLLNRQGYLIQEQLFEGNYVQLCYTADTFYLLMDYGYTMICYDTAATSVADYREVALEAPLLRFTTAENGTIFGIDRQSQNRVLAYTKLPEELPAVPVAVLTAESDLQSLCITPGQTLYVMAENFNDVYTANCATGLPHTFANYKTGSIAPVLQPYSINNDWLLDENCDVYTMQTESPAFTLLQETGYTVACNPDENTILGAADTKEYLEQRNLNSAETERFTIQGTCVAMGVNQEDVGILLLREDGLYFATLSQLQRLPEEPEGPESSGVESLPAESDYSSVAESSETTSDNASQVYPEYLESDRFLIDRNRNAIVLPLATTFAVLRNHLNSTKDTIIVRSTNGTPISSGNLGTGYTVSLEVNGSVRDRLTIVVKGDLNGTGTVNSKDVQFLYNYLTDTETLDEAALWAADLNEDEFLDTTDLLLLKKQVTALR